MRGRAGGSRELHRVPRGSDAAAKRSRLGLEGRLPVKVCPCCNEPLTDAGLIVVVGGEEPLGVEQFPVCGDAAHRLDDEQRQICTACAGEQPEAQA